MHNSKRQSARVSSKDRKSCASKMDGRGGAERRGVGRKRAQKASRVALGTVHRDPGFGNTCGVEVDGACVYVCGLCVASGVWCVAFGVWRAACGVGRGSWVVGCGSWHGAWGVMVCCDMGAVQCTVQYCNIWSHSSGVLSPISSGMIGHSTTTLRSRR